MLFGRSEQVCLNCFLYGTTITLIVRHIASLIENYIETVTRPVYELHMTEEEEAYLLGVTLFNNTGM